MNLGNRFAWPSLGWCVLLVAGKVLVAEDLKPEHTPNAVLKDAPPAMRCIFKMDLSLITNFDVIANAAGIKYQCYGSGSDLNKAWETVSQYPRAGLK